MGWFQDELKEKKIILKWGDPVKKKSEDIKVSTVKRVNIFDPKWTE
ncbi:MAG: hypothetical protein KAH32_05025 [Chlamydiia bacterium]|nr:hypothetical protein [Chlamydiia bacterium]